jgi:vacuolar protein sorting-associated protein 52
VTTTTTTTMANHHDGGTDSRGHQNETSVATAVHVKRQNLLLNQSAGDKLLEDVSTMIESFILLLGRLSETHTAQKKRTVFMINNLDHIVCIFQERRVVVGGGAGSGISNSSSPGNNNNSNNPTDTNGSSNNIYINDKSGNKELNRFAELLIRQREIFVEEELLSTAGFSKLIAFVQQTESHLVSSSAMHNRGLQQQQQQQQNKPIDINNSVVQALVLDFAANWKQYIEQINRNVLSYFSNFRNGMEILKQCLTQMLLYYTRFQEVLRKVYGGGGGSGSNNMKNLSFMKDLISTNAILAEIKKYALAI